MQAFSFFFFPIELLNHLSIGERLGKISKRKLAEYVDEKLIDIPSFLVMYVYDEKEDYSIAYRTT